MDTIQQPSWQSHAKKRGHARLARDLRRSAIVIGLLILSGLLVFLLFPPFFAPQTHLVLVGTHSNETFNTPPIPFVTEDLEAFDAVKEAKIHRNSDLWKSSQTAKTLADRLAATGVSSSDNLIVYLTAHGVTEDSTAFLLCDNFDLRQPDSGRISVDKLLEQVRQSRAATKLLIINAGSIDYDPGLGVVGNEFPRLLEQAVLQSNDPSLWVYCSHSPLQYSHVSRAARRSVFGMFVGEAFKGAADLDRDRTIKLSEFVGFTSANVSKWVAQATDRGATQVPKLIWGGGRSIESDPKLLTLFERDSSKSLTVASLIRSDDEIDASAAAGIGAGKVRGLLRRQKVTLASNHMGPGPTNGAAGKAGPNAGESGDPASEADAGGASPGGEESGSDETAENGGDSAAGDGGKDPAGKALGASADDTVKSKKLLAGAWRARDESAAVWSADDPTVSPLENKPHLWRELQAELLALERQITGGRGYDKGAIEATLEASFPSKPNPAAKTESPLKSIFAISPGEGRSATPKIDPRQVHSLALAQIVSLVQGQELDIDIESLKVALASGTRAGLDEWIKAHWRPDYNGYVELAFVKRLSESADLQWDLVQVASETCFAGERIAALDLVSPDWIRSDVERADQFRFFAEQVMFERVGLQWQQRSIELLTEANETYATAEAAYVEVRKSERLLEILLARIPAYLQWYRLSQFVPGRVTSGFNDLRSLLEQTTELANVLDQPATTTPESLARLRIGLDSLRGTIEAECGDVSAQTLLGHSPNPGDAYQAELLLRTPLLTAAVRSELLAAMDQRDRELASRFDLADVSSDDLSMSGLGNPRPIRSANEWQTVYRQSQLESLYIGLFDIVADDSSRLAAVGAAREVRKAFASFEDAYRTLATAEASSTDGEAGEMAPAVDLIWETHAKFGVALQSFYRLAVEVQGAVSPCGESLASSRAAIRLLSMLDARDAWQLADVDVQSLSIAARAKSTLDWHAHRLDQLSTYRSGEASEVLAAWAESYREHSDLICRSTEQELGLPGIRVSAPSKVDLQYSEVDEVVVELANASESEASITVSLDYERELVDVALMGSDDSVKASFLDTPSQFGTRRSEPILIGPGQSITMPLRLTRHGNASESTKLVVDVYESSKLVRSDAEPARLLSRRSLDVLLPVGEVFVEQGPSTFVSTVDGLELLPYPNRVENFKFGVVNHSSRTKQISLGCFMIGEPVADRSETDPTGLLASAKPLATFEMSVPGDGRPTFPGAALPDEAAEKDPESAAAEPKPEEAAKEEDSAPKPIKSTDMPHGMIVVLTDMDTGQSTIRPVHFSVQRPRRFVVPRVGFDAKKQQITVAVAAADVNRLPAGPPIRVECRLANDVYGRTKGKLQGMITKANPVANMFIAMSTPPPSVTRVHVDVDGYPRAFIFDVPCGKQLTNVPEVTDLVDLRMTTSSKNGVLSATKSIPVAVRIDAPVGSFENGRDFLNVGIDLDESGIPSAEDSITLKTDRGVNIGFVKSSPDGIVELNTVVTDHLVELPAERLENLFIDVAARLSINDHIRTFPSIELLIDTAAPIVGPVSRVDGLSFVAVNSPLDFNVWAWDEGSDVRKVQAAFDLDGSGEFPEAGPIFSASQTSNREWVLTIDSGADAGKKTLLVRGVDQVGNTSDPVAIEVEVVSAAESENRVKNQTVDLVGTVQLRQQGVAEAEVKLIAVPEDPAADAPSGDEEDPGVVVRSTENGGYVIPGVSPGSYRLAARAVIRNKVHRIEKEVVVTVGPERKMRVDVPLP